MVNTRLMSRLFSATNEKDEELTAQVAQDIENAKNNGEVDTDELKFEHVGDGKVAITDKENGEVTVAEKAEDGNYDLYPAQPDETLEGFIHPEGDGVTPGKEEGEPAEHVEDHLGGTGVAEIPEEKEPVVETAAEGACPECGKNPCECGEEDEEARTFSVSTDNTAVLRIFSDQAFCERLFSEVIESEETAKVGDLKVEKDPEDENTVIVTSESTGDQARVTMDDDEMEVTELDSKNFAEEAGAEDEEPVEGGDEQYEALHVVGVDTGNHGIIDATEYEEDSAQDLAARLEEQGVDAVEIFDNPDDARDYAIDLLNNLGVESEEDVEEPVQAEFSDHTIYVTRYYSNHTTFMDKLFSEACNDIPVSQAAIEDAIKNGDQIEKDDEVITPVDSETAIVEDKENGEFTKVVLDGDEMKCDPISEEEADKLTEGLEVEEEGKDEEKDEADEEADKEFSDIYCNDEETKFFSEHEEFTSYMTRLFSGEADEKEIENAIEEGDQIENDTEVITPVDSETAIIEDKETGEFTKAVMDDEKLDVTPISEEEADKLTEGLEVEDKDEEDKAEDEDNKEVTPAPVEEPEVKDVEDAKEEAKNEDEKKFSFSDPIMTKFFAEVAGQQPVVAQPVATPVNAQTPAPAAQPVAGEAPVQEEVVEEPAPTVEAIEDKAIAAVQSIQAAAAEAEAQILNAKATPAAEAEADLQEAQFSEKKFSDTNDTLVSWLNGNGFRK